MWVLERVLLLAGAAAALQAQKQDPIQWVLEPLAPRAAPGSLAALKLTARLEPGWHLYSLTTPSGGPIPTSVRMADSASVSSVRIYQPKPAVKPDPNFGVNTETYEGEQIILYLQAELAKDAASGPLEFTAQMRYQACTEKICLPPRRKTASTVLTVDPAAPEVAFAVPAGYLEATAGQPAGAGADASAAPAGGAEQQGGGAFLLVAFGLGVAAIFTPCVFPMIPITVSYFLNQGGQPSGGRMPAATQALIFCLGIVFLFTVLGTATTAILGPFGVVQLASNPWVNGFIALVFFTFALSLLGAFEITLPSSLLTRLNQVSGRGGLAGTLLMGLTFSLTSFACVGPFVGTLLAASVQGGGWQPVLGMAAFSAGLAAPFFLLALFPAWLQRLPRSGGWMSRVKIVLGFVILAASLKYASNIDQVLQANVLTRERFLAAWIVLFALPGLYLLGLIRMEGIKPEEPLGVKRLLAGAAFLTFAFSLLPGMLGGRLGELDAYIPYAAEPAGGRETAGGGLKWMKNQYQQALERARQEGKPALVSFTGYACTNCHWMKSNMFSRPEIAAVLGQFVLVELYTDGADTASEQNQQFQEQRFRTVAIPFYAVIGADEKVSATFAGLTRNPQEFLRFLDKGLKR
jgi:thiol:disulfide interchange protein DsbD